MHRIVSTIQNELTHSSRAHVLEESLSSAVTCSARFQHAWSIEAWPETLHRGWSECCGIAKTALDPSLRAVVLTACVELGCGRWSSTSCLCSSDEARSPLLSADPEFTPPRSGGYERGDYYTRSWSIMYGRCVLRLLPRTDGSRVASWCASGFSLPSTLPPTVRPGMHTRAAPGRAGRPGL